MVRFYQYRRRYYVGNCSPLDPRVWLEYLSGRRIDSATLDAAQEKDCWSTAFSQITRPTTRLYPGSRVHGKGPIGVAVFLSFCKGSR